MDELISRRAAIDYFVINVGFQDEDGYPIEDTDELRKIWTEIFDGIPPAEPKRGKWILDRSGAYCCSECMEPCAGYVMMKPRDRFCKMCGSRNEVTE